MRTGRIVVWFVMVLILGVSVVQAQVPSMMSYQGLITAAGTNYTGMGYFKFALMSADGLTAYWSNDGTGIWPLAEPDDAVAVQVASGLFTVFLGDSSLPNMQDLEANVFQNADAQLRIWFSEDNATFTQLTPDQPLGSAGYAMMSAQVGILSVGESQLANSAVTANKIEAGAVTVDKLSINSVTGVKIVNGTITSNKIDWTTMPRNPRSYADNGTFAITPVASGDQSVAIGMGARALGQYSAVGGGYSNTAHSFAGTVAGGYINNAEGWYATVAGGGLNRAEGDHSSVGGGFNNLANLRATVSGGHQNRAVGEGSFIGGGQNNIVSNFLAMVSGGSGNQALGDFSTIGGGSDNFAYAGDVVVAGGYLNTARGYASVIGGGMQNHVDFSYAVVSGGYGNVASNDNATVSGGHLNRALGAGSVVGGGQWNQAWNAHDTVAGGLSNRALGTRSAVGGGMYNLATGFESVVAGGRANIARLNRSVVSGGESNVANGIYATIPGGFNNSATNYAFAAGRNASAQHTGSFVWGDSTAGIIQSSTSNQVVMRAYGGYAFHSGPGNLGALLLPNATTWSAMSDRETKENFEEIDTRAILEGVANLPLTAWNYKADSEKRRYIGPVAQDFHAAFGLGGDTTINTLDTDGVTLAAIQALYEENKMLKERLERLEAMIGAQ